MSSATSTSALGSGGGAGIGSVTTGGVPGRLGRSAREQTSASVAGEIKWPELLEKFRNTQEKARRRNQALLRGQAAEQLGDVGGGPATRTLFEREQHNDPATAMTGGSTGRPGSALAGRGPGVSSTIPISIPSSTGLGATGYSAATFGVDGSGGGGGHHSSIPTTTSGGSGAAGQPSHKSRHSLAGNLGKFASGIRGSGGKDKDKRDQSGGSGGGKK